MSASATVLPGQPLPLRMLLDQAVGVARLHFRSVYPAVAIPLALSSGAFPVLQALFMQTMMSQQRPDPLRLIPLGIVFFLALAVFFVLYVLGHGALYVAAMDAVGGREVSMRRAWLTMARPGIWGTMLLSWLAFFAGLFCCILPGIYVGLLFSLVMPVMVEEGLIGPDALKRSAELIRYNPQGNIASDPRGKAFLIAFVGTLMGYALTLVVQLPFIVAQQVYVIREAAAGRSADPETMMVLMTWLQVPSNVLGTLAQTAVQLYIAFGLSLLYHDIRARKEGGDLEAALARLEGGAPATGPA
jgi:hypothetical protein